MDQSSVGLLLSCPRETSSSEKLSALERTAEWKNELPQACVNEIEYKGEHQDSIEAEDLIETADGNEMEDEDVNNDHDHHVDAR